MDNIREAASFCSSVKRDYAGLFSSLPSNISLRKNEKDVYFLRNTISGNSLYSVNVEGDDHSSKTVSLTLIVLLHVHSRHEIKILLLFMLLYYISV